MDPAERAEREYAKLIVPYLAQRAYHIPGYTWRQDWIQYITNNHPVFGICCHHKLHPLNFRRRLVVLVGSIASGLAITNLVYLWFLLESESGIDSEFVSIGLAANLTLGEIEAQFETVSLTNYQAFLWTIGAALHSSFDLSVWYLSACACCLPGGCCVACQGYRYVGSYIVFFVVIVVAAAASVAVVLRASINSNEEISIQNITTGATYGLWDDEIEFENMDPSSFRFLITWSIEMALALLVMYPLLGTVLFSGMLGCGRLPFLGGRPRDVWVEECERRRKNRKAGIPEPV